MVANGTSGGLHSNLIADRMAHEGLAEGGVLGDGVIHHIRFLRADYLVRRQFLSIS